MPGLNTARVAGPELLLHDVRRAGEERRRLPFLPLYKVDKAVLVEAGRERERERERGRERERANLYKVDKAEVLKS